MCVWIWNIFVHSVKVRITWARMKPHHTVSPRCAKVDRAIDLRYMLRTCSCTVWPVWWLSVPESKHCLVDAQCEQPLQFQLPRWCKGVPWINHTCVSSSQICSNVKWKSSTPYYATLAQYSTVRLHLCSNVIHFKMKYCRSSILIGWFFCCSRVASCRLM